MITAPTLAAFVLVALSGGAMADTPPADGGEAPPTSTENAPQSPGSDALSPEGILKEVPADAVDLPPEIRDRLEPGETIWVYEEGEVRRTRAQIGIDLRTLGYKRHKSTDGRDVYENEDPWKPWVVVDDDGFVLVKRAPLSFSKPPLPGIWRGPLGYLVCVVTPTSCIHVGGLIVTKERLNARKREVLYTIEPSVRKYQEALLAVGMKERTEQVIPDLLDDIWNNGNPPSGEGHLDSFEARRQAVVDLWQTRLDDEYGDAARAVIETWSRAIIQAGDHPFTDAEIAAARASRQCKRPIEGLFFEPPPVRTPSGATSAPVPSPGGP